VEHWISWSVTPPEHRHLLSRISTLPYLVQGVRVGLFRITYSATNLPQYSVHLQRPGNTKLLVYNHGHDGLPLAYETHAVDFLRMALLEGFDLLVTSMPLTGLNAIAADDETPYYIRTRGSEEPTPVPKTILQRPGYNHGLYEFLDDPDSYLHYFIDGAVVPASILMGQPERDNSVPYLAEPAVPVAARYTEVSYVGFSGGGTVGAVACAAYKFDRCILIAGVMPDYLRIIDVANFGDFEQLTRSFYEHFNVPTLMSMIQANDTRMTLIYNRFDDCCFADPAASIFKSDFPQYDIRVTELTYHAYVAADVMALLR
jgi:hypothetical protein